MTKITDSAMERHYNNDTYTQELVVKDARLAHAYVPIQKFKGTYDSLEGFKKGTIFKELYDSYMRGVVDDE